MKIRQFLKAISTFCLALTTVFWVSSVSATIIYDESVDGDIDAIGSINVDLVSGINQIIGAINETPPAETDRIRFTQVEGLTINSIELSFSGVFDNANIGQSLSAALFNSVANLFDDSFNRISNGNTISASFMDTFGPETGALSQSIAGAIWDFQLSAGIVFPAQGWTLTINTSGNPVLPPPPPQVDVSSPATLCLFTLGILLLVRRSIKNNRLKHF